MESPEYLVARHHADLLEILHDFAAAELRGAELAVAEGVRHLDHRLRPGARDDLESDLEADGVEAHTVDRGAAYREEPARGVPYRDEHVADQACDSRDDAAAQRPIHRRAALDVAAAYGKVGAVVDRLHERGDGLRGVRQVGIHDDEDVAARFVEPGDHGRGEPRFSRTADDPNRMRRRKPGGDVRRAVGRTIVDDDELPGVPGHGARETFDERGERAGFVVGGNDHGYHDRR